MVRVRPAGTGRTWRTAGLHRWLLVRATAAAAAAIAGSALLPLLLAGRAGRVWRLLVGCCCGSGASWDSWSLPPMLAVSGFKLLLPTLSVVVSSNLSCLCSTVRQGGVTL